MGNEDRFVSESLEALLVSIADGVREAQDALNNIKPVDAFGRAMPTYHMPYLDFELQVEMETVTTASGSRFLRINPKTGSSSSTREVTSTISGRLVAVPPGDGLPTPLLTLSSQWKKSRVYEINVSAVNSAGEILAGQAIELNINLEASRQLSETEGVKLPAKLEGTNVSEAILITDETGSASTLFTIGARIPAKAVLVLSAELGSEVANLTVKAGGEA